MNSSVSSNVSIYESTQVDTVDGIEESSDVSLSSISLQGYDDLDNSACLNNNNNTPGIQDVLTPNFSTPYISTNIGNDTPCILDFSTPRPLETDHSIAFMNPGSTPRILELETPTPPLI